MGYYLDEEEAEREVIYCYGDMLDLGEAYAEIYRISGRSEDVYERLERAWKFEEAEFEDFISMGRDRIEAWLIEKEMEIERYEEACNDNW